MAHPYDHARSSARRFGGIPEDYVQIHEWFDSTKAHLSDFRHRALRHHSAGIREAAQHFGVFYLRPSDGKSVRTTLIGEQHVREDLGRIPTVADWLRCIRPELWMSPRSVIEETA